MNALGAGLPNNAEPKRPKELFALRDLAKGKLHVVHSQFIIGRDEGDLRLDDARISRLQCEIVYLDGKLTITDYQVTNPTLVNGVKINVNQPVFLGIDDEISIAGHYNFIIDLVNPHEIAQARRTQRLRLQRRLQKMPENNFWATGGYVVATGLLVFAALGFMTQRMKVAAQNNAVAVTATCQSAPASPACQQAYSRCSKPCLRKLDFNLHKQILQSRYQQQRQRMPAQQQINK